MASAMANGKLTYKDIYELHNDILGRFDSLESKLGERFEKIELRTAILEKFNDNLTGKIAVFWFVSTAAVALVIDEIKRRLNL